MVVSRGGIDPPTRRLRENGWMSVHVQPLYFPQESEQFASIGIRPFCPCPTVRGSDRGSGFLSIPNQSAQTSFRNQIATTSTLEIAHRDRVVRPAGVDGDHVMPAVAVWAANL